MVIKQSTANSEIKTGDVVPKPRKKTSTRKKAVKKKSTAVTQARKKVNKKTANKQKTSSSTRLTKVSEEQIVVKEQSGNDEKSLLDSKAETPSTSSSHQALNSDLLATEHVTMPMQSLFVQNLNIFRDKQFKKNNIQSKKLEEEHVIEEPLVNTKPQANFISKLQASPWLSTAAPVVKNEAVFTESNAVKGAEAEVVKEAEAAKETIVACSKEVDAGQAKDFVAAESKQSHVVKAKEDEIVEEIESVKKAEIHPEKLNALNEVNKHNKKVSSKKTDSLASSFFVATPELQADKIKKAQLDFLRMQQEKKSHGLKGRVKLAITDNNIKSEAVIATPKPTNIEKKASGNSLNNAYEQFLQLKAARTRLDNKDKASFVNLAENKTISSEIPASDVVEPASDTNEQLSDTIEPARDKVEQVIDTIEIAEGKNIEANELSLETNYFTEYDGFSISEITILENSEHLFTDEWSAEDEIQTATSIIDLNNSEEKTDMSNNENENSTNDDKSGFHAALESVNQNRGNGKQKIDLEDIRAELNEVNNNLDEEKATVSTADSSTVADNVKEEKVDSSTNKASDWYNMATAYLGETKEKVSEKLSVSKTKEKVVKEPEAVEVEDLFSGLVGVASSGWRGVTTLGKYTKVGVQEGVKDSKNLITSTVAKIKS